MGEHSWFRKKQCVHVLLWEKADFPWIINDILKKIRILYT